MTVLIWIVLFFGVCLALAYQRVRRVTATTVIAVLLAACTLSSTAWALDLVSWLVFALIAVPLSVTAIRRPLISHPVLHAFHNMLPARADAEHSARNAGSVWWENELFSGAPNWRRLERLPAPELAADEQAFLNGPVQRLLELCDEWQMTHDDTDLTPEIWRYLKDHKFWGMIIPRRYGGLEFSAYAHSCVLAKIGSGPASGAVGPIVAVPNSLGPTELLIYYGTEAQKDYYLPRLAVGDEIPCFGLTGRHADTGAGTLSATGVVCERECNGERIVGIELTWNMRHITLAPVASVLGLAFQMRDPERLLGGSREPGVTCALVPTDLPGIHAGRPHLPTSAPFQTGPIRGTEVFVPLHYIIGGSAMIGQGGRMLMECASPGRVVSLPSAATGDAIRNARLTGAYAVIRYRFNASIGVFEGIQEALARIGGKTYACESIRRFTANAVDLGEQPATAAAIAKYHVTALARDVARDTMDVHAGNGVMLGPANPLARSLQPAPFNIAAEDANIFIGNRMIHGLGTICCHPYMRAEIAAARNKDEAAALDAFDASLQAHVGHDLAAAARSLVMGFTGGRWTAVGETAALKPFYQAINRYSANLALLSDIAIATLGGSPKDRESISARLGDVLSNLYIATATLKRFDEDGACADDLPLVQWVCADAFANLENALAGVIRNLPKRPAAWLAGVLVFPLGRRAWGPSDTLGRRVAALVQQPGPVRERLTPRCYISQTPREGTALFDQAMHATLDCADLKKRLTVAREQGTLTSDHMHEQIAQAAAASVLSADEAQRMQDLYTLQLAVIGVDDFDPTELRAAVRKSSIHASSAA